MSKLKFYTKNCLGFNRYPDQEIEVGEVVRSCGIENVSLSHQVMPMIRIVGRGFTACADAYLTPHIKKYVQVNSIFIYLILY
jgi:N-methylhydantoinase A/oxoprolinase/acetone carboxylase beta subunit